MLSQVFYGVVYVAVGVGVGVPEFINNNCAGKCPWCINSGALIGRLVSQAFGQVLAVFRTTHVTR